MNRNCKYVIALILISTCFFYDFTLPAKALGDDVEVVLDDGAIKFITQNTKATTGIRYKTTGFMVYREPRCEPLKVQCDPSLKGKLAKLPHLTQVGDDIDIGNGRVETRFMIPEIEVSTALENLQLETISEGDVLYLSAIFNIYINGNDTGIRYYDLQSIRNAQPWANPNEFRQYYDIEVKYQKDTYVRYVMRKEDGSAISSGQIEYPYPDIIGEDDKEWPVGSEITFTLKKSVTANDGTVYTIFKSYLQEEGGEPKFVVEGDPDLNPKVTTRNFTVGLKKLDVVGIYRSDKDEPGCKPGDPDCTPPPPPPPQCEIPRETGAARSGKAMDPIVSASVLADHPSNAPYSFDVLQGIPTSEHLFTNAMARQYLFQHRFVERGGICTFDVAVSQTYILTWTEMGPPAVEGGPPTPMPMTATETRQETMKVKREYRYWKIENLEIYQLLRADVTNYALPSGGVKMAPQGYTPPYYAVATNGGIVQVPKPQTIALPSETVPGTNARPSLPNRLSQFQTEAEQSIREVQVRNDTLSFNGTSVMNGGTVEKAGPSPGSIPEPSMTANRMLYADRLMIERHKTNRRSASSQGTIYYGLMPNAVNGGDDASFPIHGINPVTVHTPTVMYAAVSDDEAHNQKTQPNASRAALILERPFTVALPTRGAHVNRPGYGDRDYAKYMQAKQVQFPFDVYRSDGTFVPKSTWISIPIPEAMSNFYLPVWVDEGEYTVLFRSFAENAPSGATTEGYANFDLAHHAATDAIAVEVIGRIYDFHVTDVLDPSWELVFRRQLGSKEPTGASYWTGLNGLDGAPRGNHAPYRLPVAPGSHPSKGYQHFAVKTGYAFKFDLKTKGNLFGPADSVHIKPSFYFVDKGGKRRQEVDLYTHTPEKLFLKIGSKEDKLQREVVLHARLRNIAESRIRSTADVFYELFEPQLSLSKSQYVEQWRRLAEEKTAIGSYTDLMLPERLRLFIGPAASQIPPSVHAARAEASVQQWYGEFNVPAQVYIVPKGFDLSRQFNFNDKAPFFLKDGYLIVNFDIKTIRNGRKEAPHLQYIHAPLTNQWQREGGRSEVNLPSGALIPLRDGDIIFYYGNRSSLEDYQVGGTH
ncbi:hypothetical protein SAMN06295960_1841 [Paenibacillus aquistagni]|uniref:DUF5704 domain-containing protein n=2 Tax=Paenibacillus aquistagni TaxID=1852522 RepID=A0A1X7JYN4_9BACL|nr:hypothetical protein SAMN06295960_1841 [Paenibacillus aquistagni]